METRRDRALHLSFRTQLRSDGHLGGSGVSLSCCREGIGARSTASRYQIERLYFRASGGLAAVSGSGRTGEVDRRHPFAGEFVHLPESRAKIFRECPRTRDRSSCSSSILCRWDSVLVE